MAAQNEYRSTTQTGSEAEKRRVYETQMALTQQLQQQAQGQGPSAAQEMLRKSVQDQTSQAAALAASQQGNVNPGLATRNAQMMAAQASQNAAGNAATMRAQEQLSAQSQLGGLTSGMQQASLSQDQLNAQIESENAQRRQGLLGGLIGGGFSALSAGIGAAAKASDERGKMDVRNGSEDVKKFLDTLQSHTYKYKNPSAPGAGPGEHTSVMAQELEKSKIGKSMVMDTPAGKMVDYAKGLPAILAAQAELNKRLDKIEGKKPKKFNEGGDVTAEEYIKNPNLAKFGEGLSGAGEAFTSAFEDPNNMGKAFGKAGASFGEAVGGAIGKALTPPKLAPVVPVQSEVIVHKAAVPAPMPAPAGKSFAAQHIAKMNMGGMAKKPITSPQLHMQHGSIVPGKAVVKGDSPKNDIVDAKLSPGEIVIPRTVVNSPDAPKEAAKFVAAILAKKQNKKG